MSKRIFITRKNYIASNEHTYSKGGILTDKDEIVALAGDIIVGVILAGVVALLSSAITDFTKTRAKKKREKTNTEKEGSLKKL